ncbi:hypothetical protein BG000_001976 [Podila horticola]|nr:hypothetical protein BG000_001976 [Podila horticola]
MLVIKYRFRMRGSRFLISRQASFHHWEFFWAFFNIVFGAFAFCKRIVLSVLSVTVYKARMDELVAASNALNGGPMKSGAVGPEVSKVHHYYRMDPRVDRRQESPGVVGPASGSSEAPLLARKQDGGALHVKVQDPAASSSAVSEEQIRLKLSEAKLRSMRVRNRWFLYITLARNPSLCALRRTKAEDYLYPISQGPE